VARRAAGTEPHAPSETPSSGFPPIINEDLSSSRQQQLRDLSAHLQSAREEERKSIARDIHDDLGQSMTTMKLELSLLKADLREDDPVVRERLAGLFSLVDATIRSVKRIIAQLRPRVLDDLGLTAAIEWQTGEFQEHTGIPVSLSVYPEEIILEPDRSTALFRILQEALSNVARHAGATKVSVSLTEIDGVVELTVQDDGRGITQDRSADPRAFGLIGIRERAAHLGGTAEISGTSGEGTRVCVRFSGTEEEQAP
jgi:signal transduction histidine kinase